jgi:hypothetical protein
MRVDRRHSRVFGVTSQREPCSALRRARRGLVTQHGADSRRVFSHESAEQDTRADGRLSAVIHPLAAIAPGPRWSIGMTQTSSRT